MTPTLVAAASICLFLLSFWRLGIVATAMRSLETTRNAIGAMRDPRLDDDARERAVQSAGLSLLGFSVKLFLLSVVALAVAFLPILLADLAGIASQEATLEFMMRWDVIIVASIVITAGWLLGARLWRR